MVAFFDATLVAVGERGQRSIYSYEKASDELASYYITRFVKEWLFIDPY
jgi:hypothetical protein